LIVTHRKAKQGTNLASANTLNILDINEFKLFWVSWSGGVIQVGTGSIVGQNTFISYVDPYPSPVNYVAFSAWDSPGTVLVYGGKYIELQSHFEMVCVSISADKSIFWANDCLV